MILLRHAASSLKETESRKARSISTNTPWQTVLFNPVLVLLRFLPLEPLEDASSDEMIKRRIRAARKQLATRLSSWLKAFISRVLESSTSSRSKVNRLIVSALRKIQLFQTVSEIHCAWNWLRQAQRSCQLLSRLGVGFGQPPCVN
jgi:hypothetical protein